MDTELLLKLAGLVAAVLVTTEAIGRLFKAPKDLVSVLTGPVVALLANASGVIDFPGDGWQGYAAALLYGLACGAGAGIVNDYMVKPVAALGPDSSKP